MEKIGSTIAKSRKAAKFSQGELAEKLKAFGFNPSVASISSWEKDVSIPNALQFIALCRVLDIDIYGKLLGKEEKTDAFDGLNEEGKKKAKEYIDLLLLSKEYRKPEEKKQEEKKREIRMHEVTRTLRLYNLPASAGTGEFLDGEDYTEVEVGNEVSNEADFGLRIKGDSMEPRYTNGQTVWIKRCENLQDGEIGIFLLNGNAYCKKLKKDRSGLKLISLNPDYKPINITENDEIAVFGKVLN